jgi:HrpA-like RNA helicase
MNKKFKINAYQGEEVELIGSTGSAHLPIDNYSNELIYLVENNDIVLVMGETGSGKSTSKYK